MELIQRQLDELERIDIAQTRQPDFEKFWKATVKKARATPLDVRGTAIDHPFASVEVRDITFAGLDGTRVAAWLMVPKSASRTKRVPLVVHYHGASEWRQTPQCYAPWLLMGMAVVVMDFRMQGGLTGSVTGFQGQAKDGWLNLGVLDRDSSYLYHVYTDALRLIEVGLADPRVDPKRICVEGGSQGGATSLAMAALHPAATLCMADVPGNCWFERRIFTRTGTAAGLAAFLQTHPDQIDRTCETLSYFDNINLADRIRCPVLVSVGLKDPVCPPENVYAAFNKITSPKEIVPYPFGEHGGGGLGHGEKKLAFVREHFVG